MFLLTLAATLFILALTLAQGLIALKALQAERLRVDRGHRRVRRGRRDRVGNDLFLRNELGFLAGGVVAALSWSRIFLYCGCDGAAATLEDLVEVVEHEPLEI